jgi:hypothetical protein
MEVFHLVIDTSMLRKFPFQHPDFERLLYRSQMGKLRIYIPHIALEEERTAQLVKHAQAAELMTTTFLKLQRGMLGLLVKGLPEPLLKLWSVKEVGRNSKESFNAFVESNKIDVIPISHEHAIRAWARYFDVEPPFNPEEAREARRKDIPDSWILEAGIELKPRRGRHCALVNDNKLASAFEAEGFEVYRSVDSLLDAIDRATAVTQAMPAAVEEAAVPLDQLRSAAFKDMDVIVLGINEVLGAPPKEALMAALEQAGFDRDVAEHEARTMVLSGRLTDTGTHFIPTSRALAQQAAQAEPVINALLRIA